MELLQELINNQNFQHAITFLLELLTTKAFDSLSKLVSRKKHSAEELLATQLAECISNAAEKVCSKYHLECARKDIVSVLKTDQSLLENLNSTESFNRLLSKIINNNITDELAISWSKEFQLQLACHQELCNYINLSPKASQNFHTDNETYLNMFSSPLFLEESVMDKYNATLKDVFILPKYACKTPEGIKRINIYELLNGFLFRRDTFTLQQDVRFPLIRKTVFAIMILGRPGSGKSSFVAYLADKLQYSSRPLYIVRLRNMHEKQINDPDPILGLMEYLQMKQSDLNNAILVLDGLDEICALYSQIDFSVYLKKLLHNLHLISGLKLVLTSRTGYFKTSNKGITDYCLEITIDNWDASDITCWSEKYADIHPSLSDTINKNKFHLLDEKYSDKRAIFAVPILFYMANIRNVLLEHCSTICEVYDSVLQEVAGDRGYDFNGGTFSPMQELISTGLARQICREIAFSMFRRGRLKINDPTDPYLGPDEVTAAITVAMKIHGARTYALSDEDREKIKKYYALTFYYNKNDSETNAVEFAHKSIAEYFIAEKFLEILTSDIPLCEALAECFGYAVITNDIALFLNEKLKKSYSSSAICKLREKCSMELLSDVVKGQLFTKPSRYESDIHYLDRAAVMLKSSLLLFEYLNCQICGKYMEAFNSILASVSRLTAVNSNHNILIPFCLNGFDLSNGDFSCGEFSEAHLSGAKLEHANFCDANMVDAQMCGCFINTTDFEGANLAGADLSNLSQCNAADFSQASLQGADLTRSIFIDTAFDGADMQGAILNGCVFEKGCKFPDANLYSAQLTNADISKASIEGAQFDTEDEEPEITQFSSLKLTKAQYEYLSSFRCIALVNCIIVQHDNEGSD